MTARENAFCNSFGAGNLFLGVSDFQDLDPIRRPCSAQEQVCHRDGTAGLVQVVEVPTALPTAQIYPTQACTPGQFRLLRPVPAGMPGPTICPNGLGLLLGMCFQPVTLNPFLPGGIDASCLAPVAPVQPLFGGGMNGRAYNQWVKNAAGLILRDAFQPPAPYPTRFFTGAFYRLHTTQVLPGGASPCQRV